MKIKTIIIALICLLCFSATSYAAESTELDAGDVGMGTPVAHTHLYQTFHDDTYHWDQCIICGDKKNKVAHTLVGNGGQKNHFTDYQSTAYKETCTCGYIGKKQIIFLGQPDQYTKESVIPYGDETIFGKRMTDFRAISESEFNAIKSTYQILPGQTSAGAGYTWHCFDGSGLGYVFAGGLVIGNDGYKVKGTIELITGTEGDRGGIARNTKFNKSFDEYYALIDYCESDTTPSRNEFVNWLKAKIGTRKNHVLYGYDTKYKNNVTDYQFNTLAKAAKGYTAVPPAQTYSSESICFELFERSPNNTRRIYKRNDTNFCYDSTKRQYASRNSGISTVCDLCGYTHTGNENYTGEILNDSSWLSFPALKETNCTAVTIKTCNVEYLGGETICTITHECRRTSGKLQFRVSLSPVKSGYTAITKYASGGSAYTGAWIDVIKVDKCNSANITSYVHAEFYKAGVTAPIKIVNNRTRTDYNDNSCPSAYGYVNSSTSNSNWKVEGNGSSDSISTHLRITATFSDSDQFSYNQVSVRLFDSDGVTTIKHSNGSELLPLTRISGTAGTSGSAALWRGTIDVKAEINGTKQIYVQAVDSTGNVSNKIPMEIQYVDSVGPDITVSDSGNLNDWSTEKTITVKAFDAFDDVWLGVSSEDLKLISVDEYNNTRTYRITGDMNGSKNVAFFARDKVGNVTSRVITFSKLDNTAPSITSVTQSDIITGGHATGWKITSTGADHGSGISGTALVKGDAEPAASDYTNTLTYEITRSGDYYIWMKDNVGNTSKSAKIHIRSDVTYNGTEVNEIEFNGTDLDCLYYGDKRLRL